MKCSLEATIKVLKCNDVMEEKRLREIAFFPFKLEKKNVENGRKMNDD